MREHPKQDVDEKEPAVWRGRLFLWEGLGLYLGPTFRTDMHAHHAAQIAIGLTGTLRLRTRHNGPWRRSRALVVPPDCPHQIDGEGRIVSLLFLDPEAVEIRSLMQPQKTGIRTIPEPTLRPLLSALCRCWQEQWDTQATERICRSLIRTLTAQAAPLSVLDPRVAHAVHLLRATPDRRMTVAQIATAVALSPSRLAHLFRTHTGLAIRRYALWLRLAHALQQMTSGVSLTVAAHAAGFADSAHLSRTFWRMFGLVPSMLSKHSTFIQAKSGERSL